MSTVVKSFKRVVKGVTGAAKNILSGVNRTFKQVISSKIGKIAIGSALIYAGGAAFGAWGQTGPLSSIYGTWGGGAGGAAGFKSGTETAFSKIIAGTKGGVTGASLGGTAGTVIGGGGTAGGVGSYFNKALTLIKDNSVAAGFAFQGLSAAMTPDPETETDVLREQERIRQARMQQFEASLGEGGAAFEQNLRDMADNFLSSVKGGSVAPVSRPYLNRGPVTPEPTANIAFPNNPQIGQISENARRESDALLDASRSAVAPVAARQPTVPDRSFIENMPIAPSVRQGPAPVLQNTPQQQVALDAARAAQAARDTEAQAAARAEAARVTEAKRVKMASDAVQAAKAKEYARQQEVARQKQIARQQREAQEAAQQQQVAQQQAAQQQAAQQAAERQRAEQARQQEAARQQAAQQQAQQQVIKPPTTTQTETIPYLQQPQQQTRNLTQQERDYFMNRTITPYNQRLR